jgi:hypothetical protein
MRVRWKKEKKTKKEKKGKRNHGRGTIKHNTKVACLNWGRKRHITYRQRRIHKLRGMTLRDSVE